MTSTAMADVSARGAVKSCAGSGPPASHLAGWLSLAAAPTFALMALWTGLLGGKPDIVCVATQGSWSPSGMAAMYLLMSAFHLAPWLKLYSLSDRGAGAGQAASVSN
jgi:hypothetical protein